MNLKHLHPIPKPLGPEDLFRLLADLVASAQHAYLPREGLRFGAGSHAVEVS